MKNKTTADAFNELLDIMNKLRTGCPWDREQTLESLRHLTIEETFELSDAIVENDLNEIKKELGDILLHIVFYAKIADEQQAFSMQDVIESLCEKLIRRHPHVFGETEAETSKDVRNNWEAIKMREKDRKSVLSGVPKSLPAMIKAYRIQEKASGVGFDWDNKEQVLEKVWEEAKEVKEELKNGISKERVEEEFGDLLFALINYARFIDVNPEDALERCNKKFISRFNYLEEQTLKKGMNLHDMSLEEMNKYWDEAKKIKG